MNTASNVPAETDARPQEKPGKRYVTTWRNKFLCTHTGSYDEFLASLAGAVATLADWKAQGVLFNPDGGTCDDYAEFYTHDAALAEKLGFQDESELYPDLEEDLDDNDDGEAAAPDRLHDHPTDTESCEQARTDP